MMIAFVIRPICSLWLWSVSKLGFMGQIQTVDFFGKESLRNKAMPIHFHVVYGCLLIAMAEMSSYNRDL